MKTRIYAAVKGLNIMVYLQIPGQPNVGVPGIGLCLSSHYGLHPEFQNRHPKAHQNKNKSDHKESNPDH